MEERPELWREIQQKLSAGGRPVAPSNRSQAYLPRGAEVLPNPKGSAPGMIWSPRPDFTILTFPGVPAEMRAMWAETAAPWLQANGGASGVFVSRQLRFSGIGESDLAERVADLLASTNPTVAPYASLGDVKFGSRPVPLVPIPPLSCWCRWKLSCAVARATTATASMRTAWRRW